MLRKEKNEKGVRKKNKKGERKRIKKDDSNDYIKINRIVGRGKRWKKEN